MGIAINKMFAQLLFWLYEFLDTIFEMFRVLCGIDTVSVEGTDGGQSILNVFLQASNVTKAFLLIFLVAILVAAVSTIVAVVKNIVNMKGGERKSHARTLGQGFGTIIITGVMAFVMIAGIVMSNYVLIKVNDATAPNSGLTISAQLFDMSVGKSYVYEDKLIYEPIYITDEFGNYIQETDDEGNLLFDEEGKEVWKVERDEQGNIVYEEKRQIKKDENGNPIIESGWRNKHSAEELDFSIISPDDVFGVHKKTLGLFEDADKGYTKDPMVEMESFNFWTAYLVVIVMLVALIFSMLGLVKRIFDIVLLFIVLPLISATIPLDDGARFKQWRDTVVSKVILAYGAILSVNVFLLIVPTIATIDFTELGWTAFTESLFKAFLLMGGALAINGGQLLLARLMGTSADESREMAHSARALLGGAVAAGGVLRGAKNIAFGGYNKYGRYRTGILPGAARLGNTAGNFFGGQKYANSRGANVMRVLGRYGHGNGNPNLGMRHRKGESGVTGGNAASGGSMASPVLSQAMSGNSANNVGGRMTPAGKDVASRVSSQAMSGNSANNVGGGNTPAGKGVANPMPANNVGGGAQYEREHPTIAPQQSAPAAQGGAALSGTRSNDHHAGLLNNVLPKGNEGGAFTPPKK